jgi:hypothetical protein
VIFLCDITTDFFCSGKCKASCHSFNLSGSYVRALLARVSVLMFSSSCSGYGGGAFISAAIYPEGFDR